MGQAQAKKEPTPKGEITNRTTGEVTKAPKKLVEKVERGFAIKREMDALKEELDGINSQLIEEVGPNHTIEVEGLVKASISESQRVKVDFTRFSGQVRVCVTDGTRPRIAGAIDTPRRNAAAGCCTTPR